MTIYLMNFSKWPTKTTIKIQTKGKQIKKTTKHQGLNQRKEELDLYKKRIFSYFSPAFLVSGPGPGPQGGYHGLRGMRRGVDVVEGWGRHAEGEQGGQRAKVCS